MKESFVNVFVDRMMNYLNILPDVDATVGIPYLVSNDEPVSYDITGIIGISGMKKGCVYFTSPKKFLSHLVTLQGEENISEENLLDMAGEIANTIAGNVRSEFGQNFMISVPIVVNGKLSNMHLPRETHSLAIPIKWRKYTPLLVVSLEE